VRPPASAARVRSADTMVGSPTRELPSMRSTPGSGVPGHGPWTRDG
jgi:hypothetical protein